MCPDENEDALELQMEMDRYEAAAHSMQTAVALELSRDRVECGRAHREENEATPVLDQSAMGPKHLRVGVNSAMVDTSAMVQLMIDKGLITKLEWATALADGMEREVQMYRERLNLPDNVKLA